MLVVNLLMVGNGHMRDAGVAPEPGSDGPASTAVEFEEDAMGLESWLVCGGIWMVCAFCALMFVRGAALGNARSAEIEEEFEEYRARVVPARAPRATHASRSSLPRSAH